MRIWFERRVILKLPVKRDIKAEDRKVFKILKIFKTRFFKFSVLQFKISISIKILISKSLLKNMKNMKNL